MTNFSRNDMTRRAVVAGLAALPLALSGLPALALSANEARGLIDKAVGEINGVINSGKAEGAMYADFERIFKRYADIPTIARGALGPDARSASAAQLNAFGDAFAAYMARKYGRRFREFVGGQVRVTGAKAVKSYYEVDAVAELRGQAPFAVSFMVHDRTGRDLFWDMLIEGISLLKTERVEIGAQLDKRRGNLDQLIRDLPGIG